MELKDYSIEELKAELKRRSDLAKAEKAKVNCEHFEEKGENIMTREEIEQLNEVEPYCFETDREEQWFNIGLKYGLDVADSDPISPWISVKDKLPSDEKDMVIEYIAGFELRTKKVVVLLEYGFIDITYMYSFPPDGWCWNICGAITHWFPIPEPPKE